MKQLTLLKSFGLAASMLCLTANTANEDTKAPEITSSKKTSFNAISSRLNQGGDFYMLMSTVEFANSVERLFKKIESFIPDDETGKEIRPIAQLVKKLVTETGLTEIDGFGASSIAYDKQNLHRRMVLHHEKGKGNGLIWKLFGEKAEPFTELNQLPADTAYVAYQRLELGMLINWLDTQAKSSGIPDLEGGLTPLMNKATKVSGVDVTKLIKSLDSRFGIVLTLDEKSKVEIPTPEGELLIPNARLAIVLDVKNSEIFDTMDKMLPKGFPRETNGDTRMIRPQLPPLPVKLDPVIMQIGKKLIISTHLSLANQLAGKAAEKLMKDTDNFKKYAKYMPKRGISFEYVSPLLVKEVRGVVDQLIAQQTMEATQQKIIKQVLDFLLSPMGSYSVITKDDEGYTMVNNSNVSTSKVLAAVALQPVAILAAYFTSMNQDSQVDDMERECLSKQEMVLIAIEEYREKKGKDPVSIDVLVKEGFLKSKPTCPFGMELEIKADGSVSCPEHSDF